MQHMTVILDCKDNPISRGGSTQFQTLLMENPYIFRKLYIMQKQLIKRIFQRSTVDFTEFLEIFSNGDMEFAIYYRKTEPPLFY
jgi:hypothetical protein